MIITKRLELRKRTREALKKMLTASKSEQMKIVGIKDESMLDTEINRVKRLLETNEDKYVLWDVYEKGTNIIIGNCGFHGISKEHFRGELGYWTFEDYRCRGLMTEAVTAILAYGFDTLKFNRIEAFLSPDNMPSKKLIEKLNFNQEGLMKEHYWSNGIVHDSFVYALLRSEWKHNRV